MVQDEGLVTDFLDPVVGLLEDGDSLSLLGDFPGFSLTTDLPWLMTIGGGFNRLVLLALEGSPVDMSNPLARDL